MVVKGNIARLTVLNLRVCFNVDDDGEIKKDRESVCRGEMGFILVKSKAILFVLEKFFLRYYAVLSVNIKHDKLYLAYMHRFMNCDHIVG